MRKRIAAMAVGLGLLGGLVPLGGTAQAAECIGQPAVPATYACIIRRDLVTPEFNQDPVLVIPVTCILVTCLEEVQIPLIDFDVHDDEVVVIYHMGKCYYVGNNYVWTEPASSTNPPGCP